MDLPLEFEPDGWEHYLSVQEIGPSLTEARWELVGLAVRFGPRESIADGLMLASPTRESLSQQTPGLTYLGNTGYVLGPLCEVFVAVSNRRDPFGDERESMAFGLAHTRCSLGQATPLAHILFEASHIEQIHGHFEWLTSLRLWGVAAKDAEAAILSAVLHLRQSGLFVSPIALDEFEASRFVPLKNDAALRLEGGFREVEPLRLLYRAGEELMDDAAFLHAYRVLEYFWSFNDENAIEALRADASLATRDFTAKMAELVKPKEEPALIRLARAVASSAVLELAVNERLIIERAPATLARKLYEFRNSLVHAKAGGRPFITESIFTPSPTVRSWRRVCEHLALDAFERMGTPL